MRSSLAWWTMALLLACHPAGAEVRVDPMTQVRTIRFEGARGVPASVLRKVLQTRTRGPAYGLRAALGRLPFVPDPAHHPFSPRELQRDVVRLRRAYAAEGYFLAQVRYDVRHDQESNLLDITFVIEEGRPIVVAGVRVTADSATVLPLPSGESGSWHAAIRDVDKQIGQPLSGARVREGRDRLGRWWRDRGHPYARVTPELQADTARAEAWLAYRVVPGPAGHFGDVRVEGAETISETMVRRQVPIAAGDPYSTQRLEEARLNLQELDLVRSADVDVPVLLDSSSAGVAPGGGSPPARADSLLSVRVRISEADRRLISGEIGYVTDAGLSSEVRWQQRDFTGGGRSLTLTGLAQTGWLAATGTPDRRYRLAASLEQPAIMDPRTSAVIAPFLEYRDDVHDRSTQTGLNATLIHRMWRIQSASLDYQIARRRVHEYRFGDLASGQVDLITFLTDAAQGSVGALGSTLWTSAATASGVLGRVDDPANPRRGLVLRPAIQITVPASLSSTSYYRLDASAGGYLPLGSGMSLAARARFGRLFPFGSSVPGSPEEGILKLLQLRDVTFTAGGTGDVRGWDTRMLGPKVPDIRFSTVGDSLVAIVEGFVPFSGFARASFSVELQMPFPWLGPRFGSHVFLDGGRVWTNDPRFGLEGDSFGQERMFYAAGTGFDIHTPVGPIKVSVGYKLNPSIVDLVSGADVQRALTEGFPIADLPPRNSRRWQWHLAIGTSF